MRTILLLAVIGLFIGLAGCNVQSKLNRDYKGKTKEELMLKMGRPTSVEELTGGRVINIYEKSKFLKAAPINTGQFQYDKFESPKAVKSETYRFYINKKGVIEEVKYDVDYRR